MYKAYRVEHKTIKAKSSDIVGKGCYVDTTINQLWYECMRETHSNNNTHPNLWVDGLDIFLRDGTYFCCFDSIDLLEDWFDCYLPLLLGIGYVIVEYTLEEEPIVGLSYKQSIFKENKVISKKILSESLEVSI